MIAWRDYESVQRVVEVGDRFMSYVDEGNGPPIVLLHGIPSWGYVWHAQIPELARSRRVLVPDLLGYGFSDRRDSFDRSIARQADAVLAWLDEIGVARADLVGHDLGGAVALRLAALEPARVDGLCLVDAASYDSWPSAAMRDLGSPEARRRFSARALSRVLRKWIARGFARRPAEGVIEGLLAPYATEVGKLSLSRDAAALDPNQTLELVPLLPRVEARTLILWGEDDPFQPIRYGRRLAWDLPAARLVPIADAGHFVMLDQPEQVLRHLGAFFGADRGAAARGRRAPGEGWRSARPSS